MAQKVIVELGDDIHGGAASQTVRFAVRGVEYEIDLNEENAASFDQAVALFVAHARRIGGHRVSGRSGAVPADLDPAVVRAWALEQGITIGPRGRIPLSIVEQYRGTSGRGLEVDQTA